MLTFGRSREFSEGTFHPAVACAALARCASIGDQQLRQKVTHHWPEPAADHKVAEGDCLFVCLFSICSSINVGISTDNMVYLKRSYAKGKKRKERKEEKYQIQKGN